MMSSVWYDDVITGAVCEEDDGRCSDEESEWLAELGVPFLPFQLDSEDIPVDPLVLHEYS